jgi:ion channel-forming bestrophin family protein
MTPWPVRQTFGLVVGGRRLGFDLVVVGRRLGVLLLAVAAYCTATGLLVRSFEIRVISRGSAASLINTLILSLLLSFRNRAAYDRWWSARGLWGQLTNDTRNLAAKCAAFLPADVLARSRLAETLVAFAEALKRHLRDEPPRLRELPGFEHEAADPPHVPLHLAGRLFATVADWKRDGHVDGVVLWVLDAHLRGLLDVSGGCEKIRGTPPSPSYVGLLRAGLVLNVLVAPWLTVPELGAWGVPVILMVCFFLFGVEVIDSIVEEPFGRERDDLDLDRYCRTIREGVEALLPSASGPGRPGSG